MFVKGGFVAVPVGLAAAWLHVPYITHDSDAIPGLANRIIGRWAKLHAVGLPKEVYNYPADKTVTVGVPISDKFKTVTEDAQKAFRRELKLEQYKEVVFVTGGGLGALRLNESVAVVAPDLLRTYPKLALLHVVGRDHVASIQALYDKSLSMADKSRVVVKGFIDDLYRYSGAADVIISRASATSLAEFAAQSKACVIIPNPQLTGGHQTKNAQVLAKTQAAVIVEEKQLAANPDLLAHEIHKLLDHPAARTKLGEQLHNFAQPDATKRLSELILSIVK